MSEVILSIIIPLYNGRKFIKETVDRLLRIKCKKEVLIINDGSNDGSYEYCNNLWKSNPDIRLFTKKNSGIVDTRNFGMTKARGKYLLFSDHDDLAYSDVIDEAVQKAEAKKLDGMIWSTVRLVDGKQINPCDIVHKDYILDKDEIEKVFIPSMLTNSANELVSNLGHVWVGIYKRSLIEEKGIRFKKFVDIEDDYLFVFDFLNSASSLGIMRKVGYAWRLNQKSETYRLKYIDNILERYQRFYDYLEQTAEISADVLSKFKAYWIQNTVVMSIENSFTYLNRSKEEQAGIREFYTKNKSYFSGKSVFNYKKRRKRIYVLLQHGAFEMAGVYVYLDSLYRKLKSSR